MQINSVASKDVVTKNGSQQTERVVQQNGAPDIQLQDKTVLDEAPEDEDSESVISGEMLDSAVKQANKTLEVYDKYIERYVHETTHTIMYVIRDRETKEIIREFPPKKIQDMIAKMWELAGLFVDERR